MTLNQQSAALRRLKLKAAKLTTQAEEAGRVFKLAERALYDRMIEEDVQSIKTGNVNFVRQSTEYGVIQDEAAFQAWADENDRYDLYAPKARAKLINELARDCLRDGVPMPPGLNFYVREYVSQRGPGEDD